jgi:hypothetical protein
MKNETCSINTCAGSSASLYGQPPQEPSQEPAAAPPSPPAGGMSEGLWEAGLWEAVMVRVVAVGESVALRDMIILMKIIYRRLYEVEQKMKINRMNKYDVNRNIIRQMSTVYVKLDEIEEKLKERGVSIVHYRSRYVASGLFDRYLRRGRK